MGNEGFQQLHTPLGIFAVIASAIAFAWIIFVGARLVKYKEASDKKYRAELRKEMEDGRRPSA